MQQAQCSRLNVHPQGNWAIMCWRCPLAARTGYMCRWEERDLPHHNWTKFIEAKRKELQRLNNAYKNTLSNAKVELLQGFGKIVDPHTVDVDGKKYTVSATKHAALSLQ